MWRRCIAAYLRRTPWMQTTSLVIGFRKCSYFFIVHKIHKNNTYKWKKCRYKDELNLKKCFLPAKCCLWQVVKSCHLLYKSSRISGKQWLELFYYDSNFKLPGLQHAPLSRLNEVVDKENLVPELVPADLALSAHHGGELGTVARARPPAYCVT